MPSIASCVVDRAAAGQPYSDDFARIPPYQFRVYFADLCELCPSRKIPDLLRRPANALNVEIGVPAARCTEQSPDGRGLLWWFSGGSLLAYGHCQVATCPRALKRAKGGAR